MKKLKAIRSAKPSAATKAAEYLFTAFGEKGIAERLVQERGTKLNGPGWCLGAVEDLFIDFERRLRRKIAREIRAHSASMNRHPSAATAFNIAAIIATKGKKK